VDKENALNVRGHPLTMSYVLKVSILLNGVSMKEATTYVHDDSFDVIHAFDDVTIRLSIANRQSRDNVLVSMQKYGNQIIKCMH